MVREGRLSSARSLITSERHFKTMCEYVLHMHGAATVWGCADVDFRAYLFSRGGKCCCLDHFFVWCKSKVFAQMLSRGVVSLSLDVRDCIR